MYLIWPSKVFPLPQVNQTFLQHCLSLCTLFSWQHSLDEDIFCLAASFNEEDDSLTISHNSVVQQHWS